MFERNGELIRSKFREYLLPTLLMTVSVSVSNVVDSILVGNLLGEEALSAVGLSGPVVYCINAVFYLFAFGGMTCAVVAKGKREDEEARSYFTLAFSVGLAAMCLLTAAILAFMDPITRYLAGGHPELQRLTADFLTPLSFVGPAIMVVLGMAQFVRADGFPGASARIAIIANVVNLVSDVILIKYAGMGIAGAGLSTVFGYVVGLFVLIPYFRSSTRTFRFQWPVRQAWTRTIAILRYGSPKALNQVFSFLRTLVLNILIVGLAGSAGVAALAVCLNALMLTSMFIAGASDTMLPIVGILFGERDYAGIRFALRTGFRVLGVACLAMLFVFELAPGSVAALFGIESADGLAVVVPALRIYALSLPLYGVNFMMQNYYQTTGRVRFSSLIATLNGFVCVVLFALALSRLGGNWIWLAFLLSEATTFLIILANTRRITAKEGVKGLLLLGRGADGPELDVTIPATEAEAVGLSERVVAFCREHGLDAAGANRVGLAVEEMAVNTARYGHPGAESAGNIDVLVRFSGDDVIVRMRDNGLTFDPTAHTPAADAPGTSGGIDMLRKLAIKISYARQLGFNASVITVPMRRL